MLIGLRTTGPRASVKKKKNAFYSLLLLMLKLPSDSTGLSFRRLKILAVRCFVHTKPNLTKQKFREFFFFLLVCFDANKFVLLIVFSYMQTICQNIWVKPLPKKAKCPLLGDLRCSKTSLLKLPIVSPWPIWPCWASSAVHMEKSLPDWEGEPTITKRWPG